MNRRKTTADRLAYLLRTMGIGERRRWLRHALNKPAVVARIRRFLLDDEATLARLRRLRGNG